MNEFRKEVDVELLNAYGDVYSQLVDMKHFVFSTISLSDNQEVAALLSRQFRKIVVQKMNAVWLVQDKSNVVETACNGETVDPDKRSVIAINSSDFMSKFIKEQRIFYEIDPSIKEEFFPKFNAPSIFPLKWSPEALGFVIVDELELAQKELFQFLCQYAAMILNISSLHSELDMQNKNLEEVTNILFVHNTQLVAIAQAAHKIVTAKEPDEVYRLITETLANDLGVLKAAVFKLNENLTELTGISGSVGLNGITDMKIRIDQDKNIEKSVASGRIITCNGPIAVLQQTDDSEETWNIYPLRGSNIVLGILVVEMGNRDIADMVAILVGTASTEIDNLLLLEERYNINRVLMEKKEELIAKNKILSYLSVTDKLTGLYNHRYFQDTFEKEMALAVRHKRALSLLMVDVDFFKSINDRFGHAVGDQVLKELSKRIMISTRSTDIVARYGGEELAILLFEDDIEAAKRVAENLRSKVCEKPILASDELIEVSVSIGVAAYPFPGINTCKDLFVKADKGLYRAKELGRNRVETID